MKQMLLAIQFLTIIPVRVKGTLTERELAGATSFFPFAGALQGLLMALTAVAATELFSVEVACGFVILALLLSNGGFDMDGLMDSFDALAVKSTGNPGRDREKRLSVMKDSTVGATGAMALGMALLLKFVLLLHLFRTFSLPTILCILLLLPVLSKWVTVPAMYHGTSARREGLGKIFVENTRVKDIAVSSLFLLLLYLIILKVHLYNEYKMGGITLFCFLFLFGYLLALLTAWFTRMKFGGLTGDNLGALSEISEILFLMVMPLWLQRST
ncbi:MAG: adenosylcobinamide-GDP ribazoletransferase [Alphaproteobacteria bacterium]|uniref:Adenosylcobinamide-GDP ribazoletransferase n=1 Tax=Candidatus Nitrobium versatile TaxID=2884831 RepID=A0A953SI61_9BACT|nr:adenosylcobinamide-GDP ribazoletransferase [Candidatus Nitrobium versatile]